LTFRRLNRKEKEEKFEQMLKKRDIPQEYWPAMDLPEFSVKSEPKWWEFLWPLIKEKSDQRELLNLAQQKFSPGKERYFSSLQKTAHDHLKALARLRDKGVFKTHA